uniref:Transglutaminase-like cysteine peptidase n=1 Tax=Phenylobacterium glaciei TaxID=2803784 RepID=A0A974SBA0_9CAUL|nr:transglutaminase-like cysteine peptidase [Phenylobacterium glaciei]
MLIGDFASSVDLSAKPSSIRNAQPEGQAFLIRASWGGARRWQPADWAPTLERELSSFGMAALPAPAVDAPAAPKPADAAAKPLAERLKMLASVNSYVNQHVVQRTDMQNYGVEEYWTRSGVGPGATGDCEDVATEKRQQLIEQGYPVEDLFYAVAYRRDIGLHAVLVAHTETGDLVLDGRTSRIVSWDKAGYNWVKRQAQNDPSSWVMIDHPKLMASGLRVASLDPEMANRGGPGSN